VPTIVKITSFLRALKTEGVSFWITAKCLILLIGSSKHKVHRLLHICYQRTQENRYFPFSDILMLMISLQNTDRNLNFASLFKIQRLKSFQLQGPRDHAGAPPLNHSYRGYACFLTPLFNTFRGLCKRLHCRRTWMFSHIRQVVPICTPISICIVPNFQYIDCIHVRTSAVCHLGF